MPQVHNQLARGLLSKALKAVLGDVKSEGGLERYGETLTPVVNLWERPEFGFLRVEALWAAQRAVVAGGAATFAGAAVCNTASNLANDYLVIVTGASAIQAAAADVASLYIDTDANIQAALGSSQLAFLRDTRFPGGVTTQPVIRYGTAALPGTLRGPLESIVDNEGASDYIPFKHAFPVVLSPGWGLVMFTNNDAANMNVNFAGYVRKAARGELV